VADTVEEVSVRVGGIGDAVRPVDGLAIRAMVPEKPFRPLTVMVELTELPTVTTEGVVAVILKSLKLNVALAV